MKKIIIPQEFSGKVYMTSDLHYDHFNICNYCARPFVSKTEMNEVLTNNWNSIVTDEDIVFILGDFCFGGRRAWKKHLKNLKGKKYLIIGNHDKDSEIYYEGFESVDDIVKLSLYDEEIEGYVTLILCHYCLTTWPDQQKGACHCFGHSHTNPRRTTQLDNDLIAKRPLPSYDVGVDNNNFMPVSYETLKIIFTQQLLYGK